jgi:hypothetical protein
MGVEVSAVSEGAQGKYVRRLERNDPSSFLLRMLLINKKTLLISSKLETI